MTSTNEARKEFDEMAYKICSVLGGLDVTRFFSFNTRRFFEGAIEDVELIREYVSEAMRNNGVADKMQSLTLLSHTMDWKARGYGKPTTTIEAGLGYVDDRPDRRVERWVSLTNEPLVGDKETDLAIVDSVSLIFPWIVDRKSNEKEWWVSHQDGHSEGPKKEPFLFDTLYSAAWIGTFGEAWLYYPPFSVWGHPFTMSDVVGGDYSTHGDPFVKANLPENNPERKAIFAKPYPDVAQPGLSLISAIAPVYYTGMFRNFTYNDTYIASTGLDISVSSVSSLLDVLKDRLTKLSFGLLVDINFNTIVISQAVVDRIYPKRTGLEDARVTYDPADGSIIDDRRNQTYLVSDTIYEGLTKLKNADWLSLCSKVQELTPGDRGYSVLNLTITGNQSPTEFYVMYERWEYVADWVLLAFAPISEVKNAISVRISGDTIHQNASSVVLTGEKGHVLSGEAILVNDGTLDVAVTLKSVPTWLNMQTIIDKEQTLRSGDFLLVKFDVLTEELDLGISSVLLTFNIHDDGYPDCFHDSDISLPVSIKVNPKDCAVITGEQLRRPDSEGNCICVSDAVEVGGKCVSYFTLLPMIMIPLIILGLVCVHLYVERKRRQSDSVWEVKTSELNFDDPPEIIGRGTFGLVLLAEYRGTQVAVKRVIPPRMKQKKLSKGEDSIKGVSSLMRGSDHLFEFANDIENQLRDKSHSSNSADLSSVSIGDGHARLSQDAMESIETSKPLSSSSSKQSCWMWNRLVSHKSRYAKLKADFVDEMRHLSKLRHPCITTVMGAVISKWEEPLLVMEYMDHGSLYDLLHNDTMVIEGDLVLPILRDITHGVRFLHAATPQVIHGDLKAQNVLVDSKFRAKVADFGLSQKKQVGASGTPLWMAPELLRGESNNTSASDVYSFGIILYEVYSRKIPYEGEDYREVLRLICDPSINKRPTAPSSMPAEVASIMSDCLLADPNARPPYNELDNRLKRFSVANVEPGKIKFSMQSKKLRDASGLNADLLLEIFPKKVAEALSSGRKVEPEHRDCVTIFFSDIVGFTTISGSMSPLKVSDMLDRLYLKFDALSHKHDVFKMETIGDAWMGVTNICKDQPDHTKRIAEFAIDAIKAADETLINEDDPAKGFVQIRVGFHSGPVLANVVGSRNPKFAVFGDTVNTSSRMESNSLPGRIQCSDRAAELLKRQAPEIPMTYRGKIEVKGKGEMNTFWVNEHDPEGLVESHSLSSNISEQTPLLKNLVTPYTNGS